MPINPIEEQLVVLVDPWQEKYERLLEAHEKIQKLNQSLEDKLLKLAEDRQREKTGLGHQIQDLTQRLVDARVSIHQLQDENQRYRNDINVVVQLLQCKPSNFISPKIDTLPEDLQRKVLGQRNGLGKKEKKIIKVQVPTLPPTDIMYAVDKTDPNGSANATRGKSARQGDKDIVSAAIIARILQERENERKENHKNRCRCASRIILPTFSRETQTLPSCTISYSDFPCSDDDPPPPHAPLPPQTPYSTALDTPSPPPRRKCIQTDLDDICLDYVPEKDPTDFPSFNPYPTSTPPQHHHHQPHHPMTMLPGYASSRSSSSGCSSQRLPTTSSSDAMMSSRESSFLHHQSSSSSLSSPTSSTTSNPLLPESSVTHLIDQFHPPLQALNADILMSLGTASQPSPPLPFIKTTTINNNISDSKSGTLPAPSAPTLGARRVAGHCIRVLEDTQESSNLVTSRAGLDNSSGNNNNNSPGNGNPGAIYWRTTVLVQPPPRNYTSISSPSSGTSSSTPPPPNSNTSTTPQDSSLSWLMTPTSPTSSVPSTASSSSSSIFPSTSPLVQTTTAAGRKNPPTHLDLMGITTTPSTSPPASVNETPSNLYTPPSSAIPSATLPTTPPTSHPPSTNGPSSTGLSNPLCGFHGNGTIMSSQPVHPPNGYSQHHYPHYQPSQPPHQYYRAQKRTFWTRSSSTTSTETEI